MLLLDTGARLSEITTLRWENINLKTGTISLYRSKVGNESILHMTDRIKNVLNRRMKSRSSEFIFTDRNGSSKKSVAGIRSAIKRAGLEDCTLHTMRHTAATRLVQAGMPLYEVSNILGHSNILMTARYAHLAKADVSKRARDILNGDNHTSYKNQSTSKKPEKYTHFYQAGTQSDPYSSLMDLDLPIPDNFSISTK
nr:site-specific integrase [Methylomonas koyamae]